MGDMGEIFNAMKKASQEKRASNRESSTKILSDSGLTFTSHNVGAHLVVWNESGASNRVADFWPGTGKWKIRGGMGGRGVRKLMKRLNSADE